MVDRRIATPTYPGKLTWGQFKIIEPGVAVMDRMAGGFGLTSKVTLPDVPVTLEAPDATLRL